MDYTPSPFLDLSRDEEAGIFNCPVLVDEPDARDFQASELIAGAPELPMKFSLRDFQSKIKNQGRRGACTAFSTVAGSECLNRDEYPSELDLSEEFLFKKAKEIDIADYGYHGYGAYVRSAIKALQKYGTCLETSLPYKPNASEDSWKNLAINQAQMQEAAKFKISSYASVKATEQGIKQALFQTNSPVVGVITLYESYRKAKTNGGVCPAIQNGEKLIGNHAVLFVGWENGNFICKNSWGEEWGDRGYIHWPLANLNHTSSLWTTIDEKNHALIRDALIAANRKLVPEWALPAWDEAIKRGEISPQTRPGDLITKAEYFVFKARERAAK